MTREIRGIRQPGTSEVQIQEAVIDQGGIQVSNRNYRFRAVAQTLEEVSASNERRVVLNTSKTPWKATSTLATNSIGDRPLETTCETVSIAPRQIAGQSVDVATARCETPLNDGTKVIHFLDYAARFGLVGETIEFVGGATSSAGAAAWRLKSVSSETG
jgi:hypothetical protein